MSHSSYHYAILYNTEKVQIYLTIFGVDTKYHISSKPFSNSGSKICEDGLIQSPFHTNNAKIPQRSTLIFSSNLFHA
jgi:hypothetical protein